MLKIIGIVVVVLLVGIAGVLAYAATKPNTFQVQRTTSINAPPDKIFPLLNDLHNFPSWSPYEKKDPAMKRTYTGAAAGKGSIYAWDGDKNVGAGSMEITDSSPPSVVTLKLDFVRPFEGHNVVTFTLAPPGAATTVTWAMDGPVPYFAKIIHVFFNMDRMVGDDFEIGLANLKQIAESK
jgi:uncharacterized protein YndB with AHSA1/START domain